MLKIGCCGWSYFSRERGEEGSILTCYARRFSLVEVNSTFYHLPILSTAEKWRIEVDCVNKNFEFTVKVPRDVTHTMRFNEEAIPVLEKTKEIAKRLRAKILLFQTAKSFTQEDENIERLEKFFTTIDKNTFLTVLEVRWKDEWREDIVKEVFPKLGIDQVVDPLRQDCFYKKDIAYYRLHGFGRRMYDYRFSDDELKEVYNIIRKEKLPTYVLFNNYSSYEDAMRFEKLIQN